MNTIFERIKSKSSSWSIFQRSSIHKEINITWELRKNGFKNCLPATAKATVAQRRMKSRTRIDLPAEWGKRNLYTFQARYYISYGCTATPYTKPFRITVCLSLQNHERDREPMLIRESPSPLRWLYSDLIDDRIWFVYTISRYMKYR